MSDNGARHSSHELPGRCKGNFRQPWMWVTFRIQCMDSLTSFRVAGVVQWTLTESTLDAAEIRRRLEGSRDRQFRALSFPAGIETIEEMEKMWAKIDFGSKQNAQDIVATLK